MRVVYITDRLDYCNGVTTYLYNLISQLPADFETWILASTDEAADRFKLLRVKIIVIKDLAFERRGYITLIRLAINLRSQISQIAPDIIHTNTHYAAFISKIVKRITARKFMLVQTVHSLFPKGRISHFQGERLIFINRYLAEKALSETGNVRHYIIYNGINFSEVFLKEEYNPDSIVITAASRIVESKGIGTLVEAVSGIEESYRSRIKLIIAGEGEIDSTLISKLDKSMVNYSLPGVVKEMGQLYKETDIFVFPSLEDSFGYSWLEALNEGCYLIVSDLPALERIIKDQDNLLVFDRYSSSDLRDKIIQAVDMGNEIRKHAVNLRSSFKLKYTAAAMASETAAVYRESE